MRGLLDTQAVLWFVLDDPRLSLTARDYVIDPNNELFISPASYWEVAIKVSIRKYELISPFETFWRKAIGDNRLRVIPIEVSHAAMLVTMPFHHRDPFDRMIVAQALVEKIPLISNDAPLDAYGVQRIW